jgi:hypothetical protein
MPPASVQIPVFLVLDLNQRKYKKRQSNLCHRERVVHAPCLGPDPCLLSSRTESKKIENKVDNQNLGRCERVVHDFTPPASVQIPVFLILDLI